MDNWIPTKERLPEKDGNYLVTIGGWDSNSNCICIRGFAKKLCSVDDFFFSDKNYPGWYEYDDNCIYHELVSDAILAWMPLPKAYKEVRTDE